MAENGKHANKVVVNGETILDLTQDTVEPSSLLKGTTAHDKSGAQVTGTYEAPVTSVNSKTGAVVLSASDVGAQPAITANGFLKGDGSGNITADKPAFRVVISEAQDGTITANKTPEEIYAANLADYAVYARYENWDFTVLLSLTESYPRTATFFGPVVSTDDEIMFLAVKGTSNGWNGQLITVPLANSVVPTTRTINSKPLSANITLNAADVNAVGLTGDQVIAGDKTFKGNITFTDDDNIAAEVTFVTSATFQHTSTVVFTGARVFFDESTEVDFTNATITGLHGLLPSVGLPDNGKFLRVVNGAWAAATVENANGVSF